MSRVEPAELLGAPRRRLAPDSPERPLRLRTLERAASSRLLPAALATATLTPLAAESGGYFPVAWGVVGLVFLWAGALALALSRRLYLSRSDVAFLGTLAAVMAWSALSITWSESLSRSILEVERCLVYVAGVGTALLVTRGRSAAQLLAGVLAAISLISLYALATQLYPDRVGEFDPVAGSRLAQPIGWWNGLAAFVVLGILLAIGFATRSESIGWRMTAGAALVPLTCTAYFTASRGGWLALGAGLAGAVAIDPRRLALLSSLPFVGAAPAAAVAIAARSKPLTQGGTLSAVAHDGHRVALWIVALAVAGALAAAVLARAERSVSLGLGVRRAYALALLVLLAAGLAVFFAREGSPVTVATRAYRTFVEPPTSVGGINQHLRDLSGNGRAQIWAVAWRDFTEHPWLGSGAGTYEIEWLESGAPVGKVRDAHDLYVETLAELGPVGLMLVLAALLTPVFAAVRARRHPLAAPAFGAYLVFLTCACLDWDWEIPAVTLSALLCGVALTVMTRSERSPSFGSTRARSAAFAVTAVLGAFAFVGLLGNEALAEGTAALAKGAWTSAATKAQAAERWAPWSPDPWSLLGEARLEQGDSREARSAFRHALAKDRLDWALWLDLARTATGAERQQALVRAHRLNPGAAATAALARELGVRLPKPGREVSGR